MASDYCVYPNCSNLRKISRTGKELTMCEAHNREYWRRQKSKDWDGWQGHKPGKRGGARTKRKAAALPAPEPPKNIRVLAQRCDTCQIKRAISEFAPGARTCTSCASVVQVISIIDPVKNTVRHARVIGLDEAPRQITGYYGAFVQQEKESGALVVVEG